MDHLFINVDSLSMNDLLDFYKIYIDMISCISHTVNKFDILTCDVICFYESPCLYTASSRALFLCYAILPGTKIFYSTIKHILSAI